MMSEGCDTMYGRVRYDVGRVQYAYDVRKGAIRVSPTRYKCYTRIMPGYPISIKQDCHRQTVGTNSSTPKDGQLSDKEQVYCEYHA